MARKNIGLTTLKRELLGKKVKRLRSKGETPAVVYGRDFESVSVSLNTKDFQKVFKETGYTRFIDLDIDGKKEIVLVKNVTTHPLKRELTHVELYKIDMKSEITTTVPLIITGLSPAVKNNLGLQITPVEDIDIRCLPTVLPENLEINVDGLVAVGDSILIKDIVLPEGVVLDFNVDENQAVVMIIPPQIEEKEEEIPVVEEDAVTEEGAEKDNAEVSE